MATSSITGSAPCRATAELCDGLTVDTVASGAVSPLRVDVLAFDEAVDKIEPRKLGRRLRRPRTRVLVALAGVQTNQFPRALDLGRQFRAEGFDVMMGGFHVSGSTATAHGITPECQAAMDAGITLVLGEVEDHPVARVHHDRRERRGSTTSASPRP